MGDKLDELEDKIEQFKSGIKDDEKPASDEFAARQTGMRAGSEFMAYIFSGGFVGWLLGTWLGHMPLWLILMMFLGFGMGIYRASQIMK